MTTIRCDTGNPYLDTVNVVDGDGKLLKRIDLVDALVNSKFASVLLHTSSRLRPASPQLHSPAWRRRRRRQGIAPGDLVVSLRNLSAFAILDGETARLKLLVRGGFFQQHSVQHLEGSTFLMFDNLGHDDVGGPSRLLMVDISDGRETTIFPNDTTPEALRSLFSRKEGQYRHLSRPRAGHRGIHRRQCGRGGPAIRWRGVEHLHLPARRVRPRSVFRRAEQGGGKIPALWDRLR